MKKTKNRNDIQKDKTVVGRKKKSERHKVKAI